MPNPERLRGPLHSLRINIANSLSKNGKILKKFPVTVYDKLLRKIFAFEVAR